MKKLLLLAAVFATGFTAMGQQKADEVIKVNVETFDFGRIRQGVPVTTNFIIVNISDKPVVIENAWAGCGCTTPEFSKEPFAAKGTTTLKVGYNAAAMGHFTKDVFVKIAGVQEPKVLKITGEVVDANAVEVKSPKTEVKVKTEGTKTKTKG